MARISPQEIRDMVADKPLLQQIALIYYRFSRGEQDIALADYVLEQVRKLDIEKYYMDRLLDEAGITRKQWDRWSNIASNRTFKLEERGIEIDESNNWIAQMSELAGLSDFQIEEIENVETSISEIDVPTGPQFTFQRKLEAIDAVMHNYHAGIAPLEIVGVDRNDLFRLAEFLKHARTEELAFVVDAEPETSEVEVTPTVFRQSSIEGYYPSGTPIYFGDRRPVHVRGHRRRV